MVESGSALAAIQHDAVLAALEDGRIEDARRLGAEAIAAAQTAFGPDSPDLANVTLSAALVEEAAGNFHRAQVLGQRAASVASALVSTVDTELMGLWVDIEVFCAHIASLLGIFDAAETRLEAAIAVAGRVLAPDDRCLLAVYMARGINAKYAGWFEQAEANYECVRTVVDVEPIDDSETLCALLHNLAGLAHSRRHYSQGLAYAERGLRLRVATVGPRHPDVARDLNGLGSLHQGLGDTAAAVAAYERALEIFEKTLGADHYEVGMASANLAVATAELGNAAAALELYERAILILNAALRPDHPDVVLVQHNLAVLLADEGDVDTALDLLANSEAALAAHLPDTHPRRIDLRSTIDKITAP